MAPKRLATQGPEHESPSCSPQYLVHAQRQGHQQEEAMPAAIAALRYLELLLVAASWAGWVLRWLAMTVLVLKRGLSTCLALLFMTLMGIAGESAWCVGMAGLMVHSWRFSCYTKWHLHGWRGRRCACNLGNYFLGVMLKQRQLL